MKKITRGVRFEPMLIKRCEALASVEELTFSEWLRQLARREVGLRTHPPRKNGR